MTEIRLAQKDVTSAADIQRAIDALGTDGGRVVLPEIELELDRGLALYSNVELTGQGQTTILRKARGRVYPLAGYHNYGMYDVPLEHTRGLEPGMTVAVRDKVHGGFFETFARITWVEDTWVGLDRGLDSDYVVDQEPVLITSFPLVFGLGVQNVAVRGLTLDGNRVQQPAGIGACRGAAVYFCRSHHFEVSGVEETDFPGEGLGFQMCSHALIQDCRFTDNAGNGYHPGAGSTSALFKDRIAEGNDAGLHGKGDGTAGFDGVDAVFVAQTIHAGHGVQVADVAVGAQGKEGFVFQGRGDVLALGINKHVGALDDAVAASGVVEHPAPGFDGVVQGVPVDFAYIRKLTQGKVTGGKSAQFIHRRHDGIHAV